MAREVWKIMERLNLSYFVVEVNGWQRGVGVQCMLNVEYALIDLRDRTVSTQCMGGLEFQWASEPPLASVPEAQVS